MDNEEYNKKYSTNKFFTQKSGVDYGFNDNINNKSKRNTIRDEPNRITPSSRFHSYDRVFSDAAKPRNYKIEEQLFTRSSTGVNFDSYDNIPIRLSDQSYSFLKSFTDLKFDETLSLNIQLCGYDKPTPIQKTAIPILLSKRDLIGCAQTGSGKTAAYLLPIIESIHELFTSPNFKKNSEPYALVLAPTRELARQIESDAQRLSYRTSIRTVSVYGGTPKFQQVQEVRKGCDILIATPGRLNDYISSDLFTLENIQKFVLDEADRMLDMGFEPQIRRITELSKIPPKSSRQTILFSATYPPKIKQLALDFLNDPVHLTIGQVGSASDTINQDIIYVEEHNKLPTLLNLLARIQDSTPDFLVLVFVEKKSSADYLEYELYKRKYKVVSIHGDRRQVQRDEAMELFKTREANILVATDVAQRGLDVPNVTHVINYSFPNEIDDYVHRIGRTGRAGNTGCSISFFNNNNLQLAHDLIKILQGNSQTVPQFLLDYTTYRTRSIDYIDSYSSNNRYQGFNKNRSGPRRNFHSNRSASDTWDEY